MKGSLVCCSPCLPWVVAICPKKACYQKHYLSYLSPAHVFGNIYTVYLRLVWSQSVEHLMYLQAFIASSEPSCAVTDGDTGDREMQLVSRRRIDLSELCSLNVAV